ncbi:hypothetical protein [Levilactobacillus tujiorum]|uniref:DUF3899 domain-containing protein n=1 Tax=Levilactobacillus tujiorum TaxID=2912243 RepID=A0ABX1L1X7_9LACO|nr:hypothetical protein [Levilactobacillus tujiorum]MCH5464040.1 hypothetical protein [Levilactobacillus tujiorum]NLR11142.1 hypothetical protein [Lactobacillus sp. HBUAS51387]NLR29025.1 hypothetical protein [Levilactobacillus tujiorum]
MKLSGTYWLRQAGIGLIVILIVATLGHLNYTQWRLMPGITGADWYFLVCWLCFPFAKWVVLEDRREVKAPTIRRRKKSWAADQTASVYEKMARPAREPRLEAAPKTPLKWYWRVLIDLALAFVGPLILGGFVTYSLRHN